MFLKKKKINHKLTTSMEFLSDTFKCVLFLKVLAIEVLGIQEHLFEVSTY